MSKKNPIEEKITKQKKIINEDKELKKKDTKRNFLIIITSILLFSLIIIQAIRTLLPILGK